MTTKFDWAGAYYKWLKDNTAISELSNGWTVIGTPFLDRHNDGLSIYARKEGRQIILSDDGYILSDLEADGVSLRGNRRQRLLDSFLAAYGVENKDGELRVVTDEKDYPKCKHMLIHAMLAVNDMFLLADKNMKSIFLEDVASFLNQQDVIFTPSFIAKGSTGLDFTFNFQIAGRKSEILINTFNSVNKGNLTSFLFDWMDIREARARQAKKTVTGLAIINDLKKAVEPKYLEALTAKGTNYILFSERTAPENLEKLKAA